MGLFDSKMTEFAKNLVGRLSAYASANNEIAHNPASGEAEAIRERRKTAALTLLMICRAITDVAGLDEDKEETPT
jgi:hypothetical protein